MEDASISLTLHQLTLDSASACAKQNNEMKNLPHAKSKELLEIDAKNSQLSAQLNLAKDSLTKTDARLIKLTNQNAPLKTEKERLKLDLEKQKEGLAQSPSTGEPLWCDFS